MAARSRHAKPKSRAAKIGPLAAAAVTLAGVTAAFVLLQGGAARAGRDSRPLTASKVTSRDPALTDNMLASMRRASAALQTRATAERLRAAARARAARSRQRAERAARRQAQQSPTPTPTPAPRSSPPPATDAAHSALGICIRNSEEGGSYAWGPGNGGGAYQFLLSTWERYGGAASQFGVAGPAYQDRIFDNAIAAGGASNWTAYDGC
jgi:Transglycosylase-like domain